ncbi:MAG: glycosyltransferase [Trebonia sp.]|jgi:GT2 family glycosyltransferase
MKAPIAIGELELTEPITDVQLPARADGAAYTGARLLVRVQSLPVGYVHLAPGELGARDVGTRVWQELGPAINARRARAGLAALDALPAGGLPAAPGLTEELSNPPLVSVVVCTRDRPDSLLAVLRGLTALHYQPYEIVVVDNAPGSDAAEQLVRREFGTDPRVRYVREPRPGLSSARNRGIAEAAADIVAFTDDDVRIDRWWLDGIVRGFRAGPDVGAVTGLIATAEIENAEQLYFHLREHWGTNCERRVYDLAEHRDGSPLYPYSVGTIGAGANFAISRAVIKEIGGFNEALGAGTPAGGGEDLNMFMRILLSGHSIVYEPSAIVSHVHRATLEALSRQMRAYGSGCTAALAAIVLDSPRARRELPPKVLQGIRHMMHLSSEVRDTPTLPSGLLTREAVGLVIGPWLYLRGRRSLRRFGQIRS